MRSILIFLTLFWLLAFPFSLLRAEEAEELIFFDDLSDQIISEVNAFRAAPLTRAEELGLCLEELKALWEEKELRRLEVGLAPLARNEVLDAAAHKYLEAMVQEVSSVPSISLEELATSLGYKPLLLGRSFAVLLFEHFLPPEEAYELLLRRLFKEALKREGQEGAALLFPPYQDIGLSFCGGRLSLEGQAYNFYALFLVPALPEDTPRPLLVGRVYQAEGQPALARVFLLRGFFLAGRTRTYPDGSFFFELSCLSPGEELTLATRPLTEDQPLVEKAFSCAPPQRIDLRFEAIANSLSSQVP